jgi:hypothetical protein
MGGLERNASRQRVSTQFCFQSFCCTCRKDNSRYCRMGRIHTPILIWGVARSGTEIGRDFIVPICFLVKSSIYIHPSFERQETIEQFIL